MPAPVVAGGRGDHSALGHLTITGGLRLMIIVLTHSATPSIEATASARRLLTFVPHTAGFHRTTTNPNKDERCAGGQSQGEMAPCGVDLRTVPTRCIFCWFAER